MQKRIKTSVKRMTAGLLAFALVFSGMNMPVGAYAEELLSDETSIVSEEYESSVSEGYFVTEDVSESQPETEDEADITEADETEESEEEEIILSEEEGYASTEDGMIALTYMDTPGDHNAPAYYPSSKGGVDALRSTPLPSKYNSTLEELAEQSYPNTRQQNPWGSCWAHAAMATAEISMIKQGHANSSVDYSEFALAYFFYNTVEDPLGGTHGDKTELKAQSGETLGNTSSTMNYMERGGNNAFTWRALATWMGATEEKGAVVYPHSSSLPADPADSYAYDDAAILKDVRIYNPNTNRDGVKEAIRQSGAVAGSIYWSDGFYNSTYNSYYNPNTSTNHAITIVGWDDDFPASNFEQWTDSDGKTYPEGNGAWLVRNSWSETPRFSRLSYLWLSYEDKSINAGNLYQQIFVPASTYDNNYQYDGCVETSGSHRNKVANIFTIKGLAGSNAEILKAVSFSISEASDVPYTIKVYKNVEAGKPESGSLAATVSGTTTYAGYYTVDLDTPVLMARNTRFSVVVETEGDNKCVDVEFGYTGNTWIKFSCDSSDGESFVYSNDKWVEPSSVFFSSYSVGNICVKAFTKDAVVDGKYRICFDGNGSTSGSMAFLNVSPGEEIQLSANKFERKGWFFKGWNTDPDGKGVSYTDGAKIKDAAEAGAILTLYAQWEYVNYEIRFFGYPDSAEPTFIMSDLKSSDGEITLPNYSSYSKTGYSCKGWCFSQDGTGTIYAQNTKLPCPADPYNTQFSMYAIWQPDTYTLILDSNCEDVSSNSKIITYDVSYGELPELSRAGHVFWGWYTDRVGGTKVTGEEIVTKPGDVTIYAHWYTKELVVTLDAGTGSVSENSIRVYGENAYGYRLNEAGEIEYQELPAATPPNGYNFVGWFTSKTEGTQVTAETMVLTDAKDHTLYAQYARKCYKIAFSASGGTGSMETIEAPLGEKVSLPKNAFSKDGYFFDGWKATIDGTVNSFKDEEEVIDLAEEGKTVTLRAQWLDVEYSMCFYGYQQERPAITMSKWRSSYGQVTLPAFSETKYGYSFAGWSFNSDGSGTVYPAGTKIDCPATPDNTEISMYSVWKPDKYKLILDSNCEDVSSNTKDIYFDASYGELPEMSRPGHVFWGWYTDKARGNRVTGEETVKVPGDVTVYAHWYTKKLVVTLDPGAGSVPEKSITVYGENTYSYRSSQEGELEDQEIPKATAPEGLRFMGWFTEKEGGKKVTAETIVSAAEDHTLYARYASIYGLDVSGDSVDLGRETPGYTYPLGRTVVLENTGLDDLILKDVISEYFVVSYDSYALPAGESIEATITAKEGLGKGKYSEILEISSTTGQSVHVSAAFSVDWYLEGIVDAEDLSENVDYILIGDTTIVLSDGIQTKIRSIGIEKSTDSYDLTFEGNSGDLLIKNPEKEAISTNGSISIDSELYLSQPSTGDSVVIDPVSGKLVNYNKETVKDLLISSGEPIVRLETGPETIDFGIIYAGHAEDNITRKISFTNTGNRSLHITDVSANGDFFEFDTRKLSSYVFKPCFGLILPITIRDSVKDTISEYEGTIGVKTDEGVTVSIRIRLSVRDTGLELFIEDIRSYEYTGSEIKPEVNVYYMGKKLTASDYTLSYSNNVNAGGPDSVNSKGKSIAPTVKVKGKGNYEGTAVKTFTITPKDISAAKAEDVYAKYTGSVIKGKPVITDGSVKLKEGKDYDLFYEDSPIAVGTYEVTAAGKGNYEGRITCSEIITEPVLTLISKAKVSKIPDQKYTGYEIILAGTAGEGESKALTKNKEFDLTVKTSNGKLLEYGVDYELEYLNNKSVGTATVIVKGIGSYSGTVTKTFKIKGTSVAKASLSAGIGTSSEYDVFYDEESKSFEYLGIPYEPAGPEDGSDDYGISLILGERKLVKGVDFTVSYSNNIKPGKASVTFTGMGGYTGSVTKNFKISAYDIGADTRGRIAINIASYSDYAKGGAKPEVTMTFRAEDGTVKELKVGEDFTVTCSNNKSMTTDMTNPAKAEIKGKGAFKGTVTGTFIINSKPLSDETIELSLKDVVYKNKAGICKTTVKLTDLDSKKALKAGKDYEKAFVYRYAEDTKDVFDKSLEGYVTREAGSEVTKDDIIPIGTKISVEITAKGNYTGTCEGTFRFVEKTLSKAIVTVADKTYLGGEGVTLDPEDLVVKFGKRGTPLTYGVDYVIDESTYKNNFKKGKATVVIKGISDRCGGTKKVTFKIKAKKMK